MSNDYNIKQILECNVSFSNQKKLKFLVRKRNIVKRSKSQKEGDSLLIVRKIMPINTLIIQIYWN